MEEEKQARPKKIQIIIAVVAILAVISGGLWWWHQEKIKISTDNAKVEGDLADVSPKVAGRVDSILVAEGQAVTKGQILMQLDDSQYKINLQQAKAALDLAQANYDKLPDDIKSANAAVVKAQEGVEYYQALSESSGLALADAKRVFDQNQALYNSGAMSKDAFDTSRIKLETAQVKLESDQANARVAQAALDDSLAKAESTQKTSSNIYLAQIEQAQAAYDNAKLAEDNTVIQAPASGIILRIPVVVGENVSAGQTLLTISDLSNTWITANIDEDKFGRIKVGEKAEVEVDAYPGQSFAGEVTETGNATQSTFSLISTENTSGNFTKVTQRLQVKIRVKEGEYSLKPGMSAVVTIYTT